MQLVVLDQMEAFANVQLSLDNHGKWCIAPWHMESLVALSAFNLNCTEVLGNKNYFFYYTWLQVDAIRQAPETGWALPILRQDAANQ
jgi:hypothetical protein